MKKQKPLAYIIDDDQDFINIFQIMLKKLGFDTNAFTTEADFISKVKEKKPSCCFIDLNINGLSSGYALVKTLRQSLGSEIPLFIVSAQSDSSAITYALEMGATDFILKPVDNELLASKLQRFFQNEEARDASLSDFKAPDDGFAADLQINLKLVGIDELGFYFESEHLLSKGAMFYVNKSSFPELLPNSERQLMTVASNEVLPAETGFRLYAEFVEPTNELLANVRKFIMSQIK